MIPKVLEHCRGNAHQVLGRAQPPEQRSELAFQHITYGGEGSDTLTDGAGADSIVFESASAFSSQDTIYGFSTAEGDKLDIADLLTGYDELTDAITDFVQITTSGSNSILKVDADGGANNFVQIATLYGVTGLTDEEALETNGYLIAA